LTAWRTRELLHLGWRGYLADNPPRVIFWTMGFRGVMQALFLILLGGLIGGFGRRDAFVGAMAILATGPNVIGVANVPIMDKSNATFWRLRRAVMHPALILFARAVPYPAVATLILIPQAAVTAVILGIPGSWLQFLPYLPILMLMACNASIMGLAAATLSVAKRPDVLAPNLVSYLILLGSGAVIPPGRVAWIDAIGPWLPAWHGLAAVRHALAGQPWLGDVTGEILVGLLWAALGVVGMHAQNRRARRLGYDDFD
jgi:ABC-2 type transport system permease protein